MLINRHKFILSKIQIPDIQRDYQRREALLEKLAQTEVKLLVMHATIGYGKTVLMSQYVQQPGYKCAWYHLDALDNNVATFMQYLVLALQRALGDFVFEVDQYLQVEQVQTFQMIRDLEMELTEYLSGMPDETLFLVLDDFQVLKNPEIFGMLEEMLNHTSEQLKLLVATKSTLPDLFTKYVMNGRGKIIDYRDLSFSREEVHAVLERLLSLQEAESYTQMLWENMEGWPAGIMFATLYLRQMDNMGQQVDFSHISQESLVQNYITYELFKNLPYEIQTFLLKTSFALELQADLCNYICGITNAGGILKYLLQENMFILHMGEKWGSYRYHSIFKSFLNDQAGEELKKEVCGKLAEYYMRRQELTVAAEYAMEAEKPELLLPVVEKAGLSMFREGKRKLVETYLEKLADSGVELTPAAWYVKAVCCYWNDEQEKTEMALDRACEADSDYLAYQRLYEGFMLRKQGKEAEGSELIQESCRQLQKKKWELPPLPESDRTFAELVWNEEKGDVVKKKKKLLSVSCFGKFRVEILPEGKAISWRTRKAMELFAYLLDLEGKSVERRVLLEQLWPEDAPDNAVAMLHNMIYSIRKELSGKPGLENLIRYRNRQYSLDMSLIETNLESVKKICSLAEQGKNEELLALKDCVLPFWGVYLEEVDGPWCSSRRAYFERSYGKVCRVLACDCEKREDFETAAALWRGYMEADRYSEEAVAGLLRAYGHLEERSQMKKVFDSAQKLFKDELGLELGEEVMKAYELGMKKKR